MSVYLTIGSIQLVFGANCSRLTKTWSPIRSVFSMDDEGISNAWKMNVIMKRPVTSTPASEARNSTVVSRGFSSSSLSFSFFFTRLPRRRSLLHKSESPVPAGDLQDMAQCIQEPVKFITGSKLRTERIRIANRPIDHQRTADNVLPRHEPPIAAVQAVIAIVSHNEVITLWDDELVVYYQLLHLGPPGAAHRWHYRQVKPRKLVPIGIMRTKVVHVRFVERNTIHIHFALNQAEFVARNADHALDEMHTGIDRIVKDNYVAAAYRTVRNYLVPEAVLPEVQLIDQQVIAD